MVVSLLLAAFGSSFGGFLRRGLGFRGLGV